MQVDFHYYCIAVLARAAGFDSPDALAIAYASQYVDDSTESEPIPVSSGDKKFDFEPVLTAYKKFEMWKSIGWSAQKRVWIPFHFLPPELFAPDEMDRFSFVTLPGSGFGKLLLEIAAGDRPGNRKRYLCKIGIALHAYADTWAHSGFSGRNSGKETPGENNVEAIHIYDRVKKKWNKLVLENIVLDALPPVGHAQAGRLPDLPFLKWKFRLKPSRQEIARDNTLLFLEAAGNIYNLLVPLEKVPAAPVIPFEEIRPRIRKLLANAGERTVMIEELALPEEHPSRVRGLEQRCENWKREFSSLFGEYGGRYLYDRDAWWREAFGDETRRGSPSGKDRIRNKPYEYRAGFWDSFWVHFHRAALAQRHFVLENLP